MRDPLVYSRQHACCVLELEGGRETKNVTLNMHAIFKNASPFLLVDRYRLKVEMGPSLNYDTDVYLSHVVDGVGHHGIAPV